MSTDWNIKCLDCDDVLRFCDANHMDREMRALIAHAGAVADIAPLIAALGSWPGGLMIGSQHRVDCGWFVTHRGHRMQPIDEYGQLDDQCHQYVKCGDCSTHHSCWLKANHEGACRRRCDTHVGPAPHLQCVEPHGHDGEHHR